MSTYEHIFLIFCFSVKSQETYSLLYWFLEKGSKKRIILQNFVIDVEKIDDQKTSEQNEKDSDGRVCITIQLDYCREWCCCHHSYQSFQRKNPKTLPTEGVWLENWSEYLLKILFSSFVYQNKIFTIWKRKFNKRIFSINNCPPHFWAKTRGLGGKFVIELEGLQEFKQTHFYEKEKLYCFGW